jgi:hypothetical protein
MIKKISIAFLSITTTAIVGWYAYKYKKDTTQAETSNYIKARTTITTYDSSVKTIHVMVALCDNTYQGIAPVPKAIGNGQDPKNNLYWGCDYGIKTFFKKSAAWQLVASYKKTDTILERIVLKHKHSNTYLIADAYDGKHIKGCTIDFLKACAGINKDTVKHQQKVLGILGNASLVSYIGHDGLMDFSLPNDFNNVDHNSRDAIVLACISKKYFAPYIKAAKAIPLVWTTGLMAPEAYTLHDAIEQYLKHASAQKIQDAAASAYAKYQRCSKKAASNLLVTGF